VTEAVFVRKLPLTVLFPLEVHSQLFKPQYFLRGSAGTAFFLPSEINKLEEFYSKVSAEDKKQIRRQMRGYRIVLDEWGTIKRWTWVDKQTWDTLPYRITHTYLLKLSEQDPTDSDSSSEPEEQ
jgi:hypothetical protein